MHQFPEQKTERRIKPVLKIWFDLSESWISCFIIPKSEHTVSSYEK